MFENRVDLHRGKSRGQEVSPIRQFPRMETLDRVFAQGASPIDLQRLATSSVEQARDFLRSYGYDPDCPQERAKVAEIHREAVDFIERFLCPAPRPGDCTMALPVELQDPDRITRLFLWASTPPREQPLQPWACAVLRVMHAITYANQLSVRPHSQEIRRQILDPYRRHIHTLEDGRLSLGLGPEAVPLTDVQFREEKARDSLILKLLHKPDNLPQSIHDRVGVRLVTPKPDDALLALQYIRRHHLANVAHLTPGRSRNTLFDCELRSVPDSENPHSCPSFRSLQFTCRKLVRLDNPMHSAAARLQKALRMQPCLELQGALSDILPHAADRHIRFLFPYEVQIVDQENHERSRSGESSHASYRQRQLRAVRRRVLPGAIPLS